MSFSIPWSEAFTNIGLFFGVLVLMLAVVTCWLLNLINLPGNWLLLIVTFLFTLLVPDSEACRMAISWTALILLTVLALLGEIVEFAAGVWGASRAGASRRCAILVLVGSFCGGVAGMVIGLPIPIIGPIIASILFAGLGALTGGILGERWAGRDWAESFHVGQVAFWGRLFGTFGKILMGAVMVVLVFVSILIKSF